MGLSLDYIDGQTPLDEDEKEGLLIKSITTRAELDEFEQMNIEKAILWTLGKTWKKEFILSEKFVRDLHKRMYQDVWRWAGEFRTSEKNIGVDKFQIGVCLKQLLDDCLFWIEHSTYSEDEIAIRLKHRIVQIHCFSNGNGRHSRLMADIVISKLFNKLVFTWSRNNLSSKSDARTNYLSAIRLADKGDIKPLIEFSRS